MESSLCLAAARFLGSHSGETLKTAYPLASDCFVVVCLTVPTQPVRRWQSKKEPWNRRKNRSRVADPR